MFFNLFSKNKDEYIVAYSKKLAEAALEDEMDGGILDELIQYGKDKGLNNKQLAQAQGMACDQVFEELYQNGYMTDEDLGLYQELIALCYMMKDDQKYRYTTIAKRCNAIYKIQEKGLLPRVNKDYANVKYREGENLHFATPAIWMERNGTCTKGTVIGKGTPFVAGTLKDTSNGSWKEVKGPGAFWITTDRVGFRGKNGSFTVELEDLDRAELDQGPLRIYEKGKEEPWAVKMDDYEMAGVILSQLLNRK